MVRLLFRRDSEQRIGAPAMAELRPLTLGNNMVSQLDDSLQAQMGRACP